MSMFSMHDMTNVNNYKIHSVKDRMAVGYTPNGDEAPLINLGYISPAGQMYSTINDLNKVRVKNMLTKANTLQLSQFFYEAHVLTFNESSFLFSDFESVLSSDLRREMSLPCKCNILHLHGSNYF